MSDKYHKPKTCKWATRGDAGIRRTENSTVVCSWKFDFPNMPPDWSVVRQSYQFMRPGTMNVMMCIGCEAYESKDEA